MCRQADDRLTKCILFGQVKGQSHVGKPRSIWNNVVLSDIHHLSISRPYQVAQNKSAWRAQTCSTPTESWLASVVITITIIIKCLECMNKLVPEMDSVSFFMHYAASLTKSLDGSLEELPSVLDRHTDQIHQSLRSCLIRLVTRWSDSARCPCTSHRRDLPLCRFATHTAHMLQGSANNHQSQLTVLYCQSCLMTFACQAHTFVIGGKMVRPACLCLECKLWSVKNILGNFQKH